MYDAAFYEAESRVARESAAVVMPWLLEGHDEIVTVVDVGCGTGEWANAAATLGRVALGVDQYDGETCPDIRFEQHDLTTGYDCAGFDLAICLEVAEHLPADSAVPLVDGLAQAGVVLFSAATPGQPGVGHINCQPHAYWHDLFAYHGMFPRHIGPEFTDPVADFYRRNMFLYTRTWQRS